MRKIFHTLSILSVTTAPLITVIACSEDPIVDSIRFDESNGTTKITLTVDSADISNGNWATALTTESEYVKKIYDLIQEHADTIKDSSQFIITIVASGYQTKTFQTGIIRTSTTAPENIMTGLIVGALESLNLEQGISTPPPIEDGDDDDSTTPPDNDGDDSTTPPDNDDDDDGTTPPGGGADIIKDRYDFDWGVSNPDSFNRPTTISDLKAMVPGYYDDLSNTATGSTLFEELQSIQGQHRNNVGSYAQLWEHYKESFVDIWDDNDGSIWDIYSEIPGESHGEDPQSGNRPYEPGTDQDSGTGSGEGAAYNREHIIPQSYFNSDGNSSQGIKNDPHFTLPSDKSVNSSRSNLNFGEAISISNKIDQSTLAASQSGESVNGAGRGVSVDTGKTIFEPVDWFKGDIARSHFHFLVTWTDSSQFDGNGDVEFDTFMSKTDMEYPYFSTQDYADMFREWSLNDPVDKYNVDVNNSLADSSIAHSSAGGHFELRNPFVDMPELSELIWG